MIVGFSTKGWEDYLYWQKNDKKILKRITAEHRLVYKIIDSLIIVAQCRYHY